MNKSYLTQLPIPFMLSSAGVSRRDKYIIHRSDEGVCDPPQELLDLIMPEVDLFKERFAKVSFLHV
jgi:hypothetical protein